MFFPSLIYNILYALSIAFVCMYMYNIQEHYLCTRIRSRRIYGPVPRGIFLVSPPRARRFPRALPRLKRRRPASTFIRSGAVRPTAIRFFPVYFPENYNRALFPANRFIFSLSLFFFFTIIRLLSRAAVKSILAAAAALFVFDAINAGILPQ